MQKSYFLVRNDCLRDLCKVSISVWELFTMSDRKMDVNSRTKKSVVRSLCVEQLKDGRKCKALMLTLGLNEATGMLAMSNSMD